MKHRGSMLVFLVSVAVMSCRMLPELPAPHSEELVLRVWDALDSHYGGGISFECDYLRVVKGRIEIVKPYGISDITVVAYSNRANRVRFFRAVRSDPGENELVIKGKTLLFNSCRENHRLFVAWIPRLSETQLGRRKQKDELRQ